MHSKEGINKFYVDPKNDPAGKRTEAQAEHKRQEDEHKADMEAKGYLPKVVKPAEHKPGHK